MVEGELQDLNYIPKTEEWLQAEKCYNHDCDIEDHLSKDQIASYWSEEQLEMDSEEVHCKRVERHLRKICRGWEGKKGGEDGDEDTDNGDEEDDDKDSYKDTKKSRKINFQNY